MAVIQTHLTSKLPQFPNSILSSGTTNTLFTGKEPTLKPNFAHFIRTKPPSLVIRAAGTDHYKTLNLNRNTTLKEIKTSFRSTPCREMVMWRVETVSTPCQEMVNVSQPCRKSLTFRSRHVACRTPCQPCRYVSACVGERPTLRHSMVRGVRAS
ncbi:hypothetical protein ACLB2K_069354 [Fragaria x ananassa]